MEMKIQHVKVCRTAKAVLRGEFIAGNANIREEEKALISNL